MRVVVHQHYGRFLIKEELIRTLSETFPEVRQGPVELDFSKCIIDYNATSHVIDSALEKLLLAGGAQDLIILFDIVYPERLLLKWLFLGSRRLKLDEGTASDEQIRFRVVEGLKELGVRLSIKHLILATNTEETRYTYG